MDKLKMKKRNNKKEKKIDWRVQNHHQFQNKAHYLQVVSVQQIHIKIP